ncbi:hypothetical protein [Microtetraspora malaysiensis]|uniref:hypothetical protein n=1 Tax=Microtetraspora malaysiensis TaxID=161358 RepID=UPI003D8F6D44
MASREGELLGVLAARKLAESGCCEIEPGLRDVEFDRIEREFGVEFADDHRAFLSTGLPVWEEPDPDNTWENPWPDWRNGDPDQLRWHLNWEVDFLIEDVERGHWTPWWGPRPDDPEQAVEAARQVLARAPRIVPVYAHRFLPAGRGTFGHPVLSMWCSDIICYGFDLAHYIELEFVGAPEDEVEWARSDVVVPFWRDYVAWNERSRPDERTLLS